MMTIHDCECSAVNGTFYNNHSNYDPLIHTKGSRNIVEDGQKNARAGGMGKNAVKYLLEMTRMQHT